MKKVPRKFICMIRENSCWDPGEQRVCREKEGEVKPVTASTTVTLSCQRSHSKRIHVNGGEKGHKGTCFCLTPHRAKDQPHLVTSMAVLVKKRLKLSFFLDTEWKEKNNNTCVWVLNCAKETAVKKNFITTFFPRINGALWAWCNRFRLCSHKGTKKPDHLSQK